MSQSGRKASSPRRAFAASRTPWSASITVADSAPAKYTPSPGPFFTKQDPFLVL